MRGQICRECSNEICSAVPEEAKISNASGDTPTAASSTQPAAVAAVGSRSDVPRDIGDYELELIYSGGSDCGNDSKKKVAKIEPDVTKSESTKSDSRSAMSLVKRRDIVGSSDASDDSSSRRSCSL